MNDPLISASIHVNVGTPVVWGLLKEDGSQAYLWIGAPPGHVSIIMTEDASEFLLHLSEAVLKLHTKLMDIKLGTLRIGGVTAEISSPHAHACPQHGSWSHAEECCLQRGLECPDHDAAGQRVPESRGDKEEPIRWARGSEDQEVLL